MRHGETYLNHYQKMQGWSNAPLTGRGIIDAHRSGKGLKDIKFNAVYTSDLKRTVDTAKIILEENEKTSADTVIHQMPDFREIFFGSFEGETVESLYIQVAKELGYENTKELFKNSPKEEQMKVVREIDPYNHAETYQDLWKRLNRGINYLTDQHKGTDDTILVVAHGGVIRVIFEKLFPESIHYEPLKNASVSIAKFIEPDFHFESYNDISHFMN